MAQFEPSPIDSAAVLATFRDTRDTIDSFIIKNNIGNYCSEFIPRSEELAIAVFCNALEALGFPIRSAAPGAKLDRVQNCPRHERLISYIYKALEGKAGLVEIRGGEITRTSVPCPSSDIDMLLEDLLDDMPEQEWELRLMQRTSTSFAQCLSGDMDPLQLLFGSEEGRMLMTNFYAKSSLFSTILQQLSGVMQQIGREWDQSAGPLRILEVGAGTGGTTLKIVPVLDRLGIQVVYTVSDVSWAFISAAQHKLDDYKFVKYNVVDIEKEPEDGLIASQHIVLGSNVLHATPCLSTSLANIRKMLKPGGFLILHELTTQMLWADVAFGLIAGWWAFEDGREHALQSPQRWKETLESSGYSDVVWNEGSRPESRIQNLIFCRTAY